MTSDDQSGGPTTTFMHDATAVSSQPAEPIREKPVAQFRDWSGMTIKHFLEQPLLLAQNVITPISATGIAFWELPESLLTSSQFLKDKLKGYLGLKADFVVRLVANADKHTSGRLILYHQPAYSPSAHMYEKERFDHQQVTQLLNAQIDLNTETEVVLRIPWRSAYSHFNLLENLGNSGSVGLRKLLPVRGNEATVSVFMALENIELVGPTAIGGFVSQGNVDCVNADQPRPLFKQLSDNSREVLVAWYDLFAGLIKYMACGSEGKKYNPTYTSQGLIEAEQKNAPLSSRLQTISEVATVGSSIPLLASIAAPVSWASAIASQVASAFGYSKPLAMKSPTVYVEQPMHGIGHHDGVDWAEPLACSGQAGTQLKPDLGYTGQDEMSIKFLTQVKSSIHRFEWGAASVAGTRIFSMPLGPRFLSARSSYWAEGSVAVAHPINYISSAFQYYRGSLEVTIVLSKTIFHTGRLMLVFEPCNSDTDIQATSHVLTLADVNPCHKDVVDIRDTNEFSITLPFVALTPYLHCRQAYGHFHVFVVNPLVRNSDAVTDTIDAMVFVKGCGDWEFNGPIQPTVWPFLANRGARASLRSDDCYTLSDDPLFESQGLEVEAEDKAFTKVVGTANPPTECFASAPLCMGERILSLKQLAMRSKLVSRYGYGVVDDPFSVGYILSEQAQATVNTGKRPYRDWYSYVAAMYAFSRGGVIITVYNWHNVVMKVVLMNDFNGDFEQSDLTNGVNDMHLTHWVLPGKTARIYIPPYHRGVCRYVYSGQLASAAKPDRRFAGVSNVQVHYMNNLDTVSDESNFASNSSLYVYRCAAEDTQFAGFVGVPLLTTPNSKPGVYNPYLAWFPASSL